MAKKIRLIGFILIIFGLFIPSAIYTQEQIKTYNNNLTLTNKIKKNSEYYAILSIPKIELKQELYPIGNSNNNVDKHVFIHNISNIPNNVILASHSGIGSNAYFKDLYKLDIKDIINIYFSNNIYTYEIQKIEYLPKTGNLTLRQDYPNQIILITCTKNNEKMQTIYYALLTNVSKI